jgi:tetratricopeptide (TPR) repeat protein
VRLRGRSARDPRTRSFTLLVALLVVRALIAGAEPDSAATVRFLEDRVKRDPGDVVALTRLSGECLQRMRETGDWRWLSRSRDAAEKSWRALTGAENYPALGARSVARLASHQFREALADAEEYQRLRPGKAQGLELRGDAALELNDLSRAALEYTRLQDLTGESLGLHLRLARVDAARGDREHALFHFDGAVAFARIAQPPSPFWLAWSLIARGDYRFANGDWAAAECDFGEAGSILPDAWFVFDRLGELRAAQARWDEAEAAYRRAIALSPAPALRQALGDVLAAAGRTAATQELGAAEAAYLASAAAGEVVYHHQLAAFYADSKPNASEAERWAREDLAQRRTPASLDALGWSLYRGGKFTEAAETAREALESGGEASGQAHLLYHAGLILMRSGDVVRGTELLRRAYSINPAVGGFHVHR